MQSSIVLTLGGTLAQAQFDLNEALGDWRQSHALREANVSVIQLRKRTEGGWDLELVVSPPPNAPET